MLKIPKQSLPVRRVQHPNFQALEPTASLVIVPDIHFPSEDKVAVNAVMKFIQYVKPDRVVQLGDLTDHYPISSYDRSFRKLREYGGILLEEAEAAKPFWYECMAHAKEVVFLPGNHEERLNRLVENNPGLYDHPALSVQSILMIPNEVRVYPYHTKLKIGPTLISHGDKLLNVKGAPVYLAKRVLDKYPHSNNFFGHFHRLTHRVQTVYNKDGVGITHGAWCCGHLSDVTQQNYVADPDWQTGFMYLEFYELDNEVQFTAHPLEVVNGSFAFGGKHFNGRTI